MGLETVLGRIRETGKDEATAIVAQARKDRDAILATTREEGAKVRARREAEAKEQAERRRIQDLARAELDGRRLVLAAQESVLREVRDRVRARLAGMSGADILRKMLAKHADEWRSGRVYSNVTDAETVRGIVGDRFGGSIACPGGVVIESTDGTRRLDLTYDSILQDLWDDCVREVAEALWPKKK